MFTSLKLLSVPLDGKVYSLKTGQISLQGNTVCKRLRGDPVDILEDV